MPRYVIERDIPEIGSAEREALRGAAQKSNGVLADMKVLSPATRRSSTSTPSAADFPPPWSPRCAR